MKRIGGGSGGRSDARRAEGEQTRRRAAVRQRSGPRKAVRPAKKGRLEKQGGRSALPARTPREKAKSGAGASRQRPARSRLDAVAMKSEARP